MAQTLEIRESSTPRTYMECTNVGVDVAQGGNTELARIPCSKLNRIFVEVLVAGQALDAFVVKGICTTSGNEITLASAAGDYTSPIGIVEDASGDLTVQAVGTGWVILNTQGLTELVLYASSGNVAGSTVSIYASGS